MKHKFKSLFITFLLLFVFFTLPILYAYFMEPNLLVKTEYTIQVPPEIPECKIVFFSDTHFGKLYQQEHITRIVDKINAQNPDIVIFGGDFIDNYARDAELLDLEFLKLKLKEIKAGVQKFAVFGNHDYGGGAVRIYADLMEAGGFTILKNSSVLLEEYNLRFIGLDDYLLGYTEPEFYLVDNDNFNIILSHEPDVAQFISLPRTGIMLSGHSHGGQVSLPFLTKINLPAGATRYIKGDYYKCGRKENLSLFVSKGIGMTVLPFRFLNPPEIVVLNLRN